MSKPCSMDLRERVVAAVETGGMSRNQAAVRFGVAPSSAIKWVARYRATGSAAPAKMGGYKPTAATIVTALPMHDTLKYGVNVSRDRTRAR